MAQEIRTRPFGPTGFDVTVIGQGTWNLERDDRSAAVVALRAGLDAGMSHVDTAEMYGSGAVEELVAEALGDRRDELFLVSKVLPQNASRQGTVAACERSLRRLRTDRLDCYLLHWRGGHPLADTVAALAELQAAGKIRSWGVSNFDEDDLAEAIALAGEGRIACNQVLYHLEERAIEHAVIPYCAEHGIAVVAYSPFGSGRFPSPGSRGGRVLGEIATVRGVTPRQVALAFLNRHPALFAIPKTATAGHARDNAAAAVLALTDDEIDRLDRAFPRGPRRKGVPTI
jgi:diketogulonate reductase-like aldo/keto reductase